MHITCTQFTRGNVADVGDYQTYTECPTIENCSSDLLDFYFTS